MAQKKFSRLSIMLEARDKMTKPLQSAAKASQHLQKSVGSLNNSLSKNSQGYQKMAQQANQTSSALSILGKRILQASKDSTLAYIANKTLISTFKTMKNVVKGVAFEFKELGRSFFEIVIKQSKWFTNLTAKIKGFRLDVMLVNQAMKKAVISSKMWQKSASLLFGTLLRFKAAKMLFKDTADNISKATAATIQNSRAYKLLNNSLLGVKKNIVATRLAFTLWKNSSTFVSKVKKDIDNLSKGFSWIGQKVKGLIPSFNLFGRSVKTANNNLNSMNHRRSTFNQLADANARLNREMTKLNAQLAKANSRLGNIKSSLGSVNAMGAAFGTAYAAQAAYGTGERVVQATVGTAMEQNYSQASVGILAGAENGAKFYKQIQSYAASTAYSAEDWARNMRGAISKSKTVEDLEKYQTVIEQLATLDPVQGLDGAALAVRELNSGDIVSLVERFELPRSAVKSIKDIKDPIKQVQALSKLVGEQTGYTVENIQEMKKLPLMQWQKLTNSAKTMMGYIGAGALQKIAPIMEKLNKMWDAGAFEPFITKLNDGFANATEKIINFVMSFGSKIEETKKKFAPFIDLFNNIKESIKTAMPTVSGIFEDVRNIMGMVAGDINSHWSTIDTVFQSVLGIVKQVTQWFEDNYAGVKEAVIGVTTAIVAFNVAMTGMKVIQGIIAFIKTWRTVTLSAAIAQSVLNGTLLANPVGLVIAGIAALIGIGVLLWRNWDTVKKKTRQLWDKLGAFKGVAAGILGPIGFIIRAAVTMAEQWDSTKGIWENIWNGIKIAASNTVNDVIGSINKMIDMLNKIPGVSIPIIPRVDWGVTKEVVDGATSKLTRGAIKGHKGGLDYVPYDGYTARLHKGEKVMTAAENKEERKGLKSGVTVTGNNFYVREESDIDKIADALFRRLTDTKTAMG